MLPLIRLTIWQLGLRRCRCSKPSTAGLTPLPAGAGGRLSAWWGRFLSSWSSSGPSFEDSIPVRGGEGGTWSYSSSGRCRHLEGSFPSVSRLSSPWPSTGRWSSASFARASGLSRCGTSFGLFTTLRSSPNTPAGVYRGAIRVLLTTVLPLVLLFHFPVMVLVGHGGMELLAYRLGVLGGFCFSAEASGGPGFVATAAPGDSGSSPR